MGFGDSDSPSLPALTGPPPERIQPEVSKATKDLKERLKKMKSRALSRMTGPGLLEIEAPTKRPILSDLL